MVKKATSLTIILLLSGCTTGRVTYIDKDGVQKTGCETEYSWAPSVDKYALEYHLSYCAKKYVELGNRVDDTYLLELQPGFPLPPCGLKWDHKLAKKYYREDKLSPKDWGYIVAHIELGLAEVNDCSDGM